MGLLGILLGLSLLIWLAFRGWSVLLLAPLAAMIAALFGGEPLLAHLTQVFMRGTSHFLAQFFPLFLLGALFGKLMKDSGAITVIADFMMKKLGKERAILAVVLAGAIVTYGGVSLFVSFFVLAPMAQELFRVANIPRRLMPAAIVLGTSTFTMSALPGSPSIQNAIPMPFFGTTPFAAPGLGIIASVIMLGFGLYWLHLVEKKARVAGEGFGDETVTVTEGDIADDELLRARCATAREFDPAELEHGEEASVSGKSKLPIHLAALPLVVVIVVNLTMSLFVLPIINADFLAKPEWGSSSLSAVGGVWSVVTALACAIVAVLAINFRRYPDLRETMDAGATASVLPALSVASLVGFGAVVAAMPSFEVV
ncbi:MAG: GntP family permease, partial [Azovibrio sp.]